MNDLQRLNFLEIKNLPLNKCSGALFESALKQAIELEKSHTAPQGPFTKFIEKHHPLAYNLKYVVFSTQIETEVIFQSNC